MKKPVRIAFNERRALEVFGILADLWRRHDGIFQGIVLPQDRYRSRLPPDPKLIARWLFYAAIPMRGGVVSEDPFKWLMALWEHFPEMFEPERVAAEWTVQRIFAAFRKVTPSILNGSGTGKLSAGSLGYKLPEHATAWHENSIVLTRHWGGDLRNVFWGVTEFEEAFRRIDHERRIGKEWNPAGFIGMRRKIFSLLVIWLQEWKIISDFPTPIPVDFHALRVLWATGIIRFPRLKPLAPKERHPAQFAGKPAVRVRPALVDAIAMWSEKFLTRVGLSHRDVNPALWVLSRELCTAQFQNQSRSGGTLFIEAAELRRNPGLWPKDYSNPCGHCPIERLCTGAIPAAPYYRWGLLVRSPRVPYSMNLLPGFKWPDVRKVRFRKNDRR